MRPDAVRCKEEQRGRRVKESDSADIIGEGGSYRVHGMVRNLPGREQQRPNALLPVILTLLRRLSQAELLKSGSDAKQGSFWNKLRFWGG